MLVATGEAYISGRIDAGQNPFTGTIYMGLSTDSTAPASTDTAVPGEQTANGLGRQAVTATHTSGTKLWTTAATFTYTGNTPNAPVNIVKLLTWDAPTGGNLITEDIISLASFSVAGDNGSFQAQFKV